MPVGFYMLHSVLTGDGLNLETVAAQYGTPLYVYSGELLKRNFTQFRRGLRSLDSLICYSVKANNNLGLLSFLASLGSGADVVSGGELYKTLKGSIPSEKIVFAGVGKTRDEIDYALQKHILMFNVESEQELVLIDSRAKHFGRHPKIAIRVNPDIQSKTHPYISTGLKKHKFGIPLKRVHDLIRAGRKLTNISIVGLSCHIGSQLTHLKPFRDCLKSLLSFIDTLAHCDIKIEYLNIGGGLGIRYQSESPPSVEEYCAMIRELIGDRPLKLIIEPGRSLIGPTGVLLSKVTRVKQNEARNFVILDAGMNDLIRPALYQAHHSIRPVRKKAYRTIRADVVGPVCESSDCFAKNEKLPNFQAGDLVAIENVGAYGFSMTSNYNARPRPAEVLIYKKQAVLIREREIFKDLLAKEHTVNLL